MRGVLCFNILSWHIKTISADECTRQVLVFSVPLLVPACGARRVIQGRDLSPAQFTDQSTFHRVAVSSKTMQRRAFCLCTTWSWHSNYEVVLEMALRVDDVRGKRPPNPSIESIQNKE